MPNELTIAKKLISCKSITPHNDGALEYLESILSQAGFKCEIINFSEEGYPSIGNLYAKFGTSSPNLCFAGHTDVVPTGDNDAWSYDPFSAIIADNILYGRGAVDMKGAIASFAAAAINFVSQHQFNGSLSFLITGDEEAISINGTVKLLKWLQEKGEHLDACVVGEPTNPNILGEMIKNGRRGSVCFTLTIKGIQGHIAYPENFDNPITAMIKILDELKSTRLDNGNEYFSSSNLEVTNIHVGNQATNVVPATVEAKFNIRYNNIQTQESLLEFVHNICKKHSSRYELQSRFSGDSFLTEPGFLSDILTSSIKEVTGISPVLSTSGGTSDARFIKDYCPVIEFGLISKTAHQVDESVQVDDLEKLTQIYFKTIKKFFKII